MDLKDIKQIIKVLEGTDVTEIEVEQEGVKVRVKRGGNYPVVPLSQVQMLPRDVEIQFASSPPMVGTFYLTPAPDAPPFVEVGGVVTKGQTLCIIEAMKLMNEIEAECSGKLVSILVENAKPVEYGEPLFMIEPS
ncbi:MAG: oxaloacetate decarboxylase, alpha subunit [Deltaproteobacteria bacterium]|nr:oxaloacetate decarboxylase, alpha subunit [Deltaproteobacteria bacterium]